MVDAVPPAPPPPPPPGNIEDAAWRVSVFASCIGGCMDTAVPTYHSGALFSALFFTWGGDCLTLVAIGRPMGPWKLNSSGERKQPLGPPISTRPGALATKSHCVEIFSSWGDLPESAVGPRFAIRLQESRQLSITYRYWRPVPCTRSLRTPTSCILARR